MNKLYMNKYCMLEAIAELHARASRARVGGAP